MPDTDAEREASRHIPEPIRRAVLVEAGHRCAVSTCRAPGPLEIHHIKDFAKGGKHEFANLLALCRNCHGRATTGEIDRLATQAYKDQLEVLNGRYGEFERRIIEMFTIAKEDPSTALLLQLPDGRDVDLWYLLRDGMLEQLSEQEVFKIQGGGMKIGGRLPHQFFRLTEEGVDLVRRRRSAQSLES